MTLVALLPGRERLRYLAYGSGTNLPGLAFHGVGRLSQAYAGVKATERRGEWNGRLRYVASGTELSG